MTSSTSRKDPREAPGIAGWGLEEEKGMAPSSSWNNITETQQNECGVGIVTEKKLKK